ncbi:MAG: hypothetical protein JJU29_07360 [Verrucomicrobia bacterium]|nr:hypothetical protein [Verrucomicrobiota bacterium]MCH8512236.1 hypothetical protein [Kiritimatiellia bacterium]
MKYKITFSFLSIAAFAVRLSAHPGHPGAPDHGDATHFLLGLAIGLPILAIASYVLHKRHRKATVKISTLENKEDPHG